MRRGNSVYLAIVSGWFTQCNRVDPWSSHYPVDFRDCRSFTTRCRYGYRCRVFSSTVAVGGIYGELPFIHHQFWQHCLGVAGFSRTGLTPVVSTFRAAPHDFDLLAYTRDMAKYEELDVRYDAPVDVEPEETNFKSDYVGTGRLYKDDTGQAVSIYDLAELDENLWMVVGIDLSHAGCRSRSEDAVYLWAVNKLDAEANGRHPLKPNADGKIPVVNIKCHNLTVGQVLRNFVDATMSFRLKDVADSPFQLIGYADRPNIDDGDARPDSEPSM